MGDIGNFPDGRSLLIGSPFRSAYFLIASAAGAGCIVVDVYLLYRHRQVLTTYAVLILSILIGLQSMYQWWRALRYYGKIRELYSRATDEGVKEGFYLDTALRIAV
jgi:hypothetical protein